MEVGKAALLVGRHVWDDGDALLARDRQSLQGAGIDLRREASGERGGQHLDVIADRRVDRGRAALERYVHGLDLAERLEEIFRRDVRSGSDPRGAEVDGFALCG